MDKFKQIQKAILSITKNDLSDVPESRTPISVLPVEKATPKQLNNAITACGAIAVSDRIAVIVDQTLFGSCKDAIIFAENGIYASKKNFVPTVGKKREIPMPIYYEELQSVELAEKKGESDKSWYCRAVFTFKDNQQFLVWLNLDAYYIVKAIQKILKIVNSEEMPATSKKKKKVTVKEETELQSGAKEFEAGVKALEAGDFENAVKFWEMSAEKKQEKAMYNLGVVFSAYNSPVQDFDKGIYWLQKSVENGYIAAMQDLVILYGNEVYPTFDPEKAIRLAAELKKLDFEMDEEVLKMLQKLETPDPEKEPIEEELIEEELIEEEIEESIEEEPEKEPAEDPYEIYKLGKKYWTGDGVTRSAKQALSYYFQAVTGGYSAAINDICICHVSFFTLEHLEQLMKLEKKLGPGNMRDQISNKIELVRNAWLKEVVGTLQYENRCNIYNKDILMVLEKMERLGCVGAKYQLSMAYASGAYGMKDMEKAKQLAREIKPRTYICFGMLDTKHALGWYVLDNQDGKLLLLAESCLSYYEYHDKNAKVTWEKSYTRASLEEFFLLIPTFVKEETSVILRTTNHNPGEKDTDDRVFLLSLEEVKRYFDVTENTNKKAKYKYQIYDDIGTCTLLMKYTDSQSDRTVPWFLRTSGEAKKSILVVDTIGGIVGKGNPVNDRCGIRPAMWVDPLLKA